VCGKIFIIHVPTPTAGAREIALSIRGGCIGSAGSRSSGSNGFTRVHYSNGVRFHARCIFRTYSIIYWNINLESPPGSPNKSETGAHSNFFTRLLNSPKMCRIVDQIPWTSGQRGGWELNSLQEVDI